jgi:hypothetical protein
MVSFEPAPQQLGFALLGPTITWSERTHEIRTREMGQAIRFALKQKAFLHTIGVPLERLHQLVTRMAP